jgi:hypothetical protein
VHDHPEEVLDPSCNALFLLRGTDCPVSKGFLEPRFGRETHRHSQRPHLLVAGVLYAALAEVGHLGTGHDTARGLVELLSRPAAPVWAAVFVEEEFEPLRYVQNPPSQRRPRSYNPEYHALLRWINEIRRNGAWKTAFANFRITQF